ncbi:VOC family protein [Bdellovibrio bacteriovorus]|uniref:VOC family protein n=1 Tax=Bdellovibrio TaxID=958 RepID=UPI0035A8D916
MSEGVIAVVCYRPKPGKEEALQQLLQNHVPTLRQQGLITDYPSTLMTSQDGTLVEIFEWKSPTHAKKAPSVPAVKKIWDETVQLAEFVPLGKLDEARSPFAHFHRRSPQKTHRMVPFEIHAENIDRCSEFYRKVFDWKVEQWGKESFWLVDTGEESRPGINNGYNTIQVHNIGDYCGLVESNGGHVVTPVVELPQLGWLAYATDTEGNMFGMWQPIEN